MHESIDGKLFHTNWRCQLHNQVIRHNGRVTIQKNIKLLKESPEKVGGDKETAIELIALLEERNKLRRDPYIHLDYI